MQESDMTVVQLIERFESDLKYDCHSTPTIYRRSAAKQELVRRGRQTLPEIEAHLSANPPVDDPHGLSTAWGWLQQEIRGVA